MRRACTLMFFMSAFILDVRTPVYAELPTGFQRTVLAEGLCQSSCLAVTADGRVFVGQVEGIIRVIENDLMLSTPLIELEAESSNEQGLCGMVLDPNFGSNGFLYVYYTTLVEERNRVSRFTVVGNTAAPATEFVVWENEPSLTTSHQGGGLAFGADGTLYISTGDDGFSGSSQLTDAYRGKVLRVHPDGSIPIDNPFLGMPGYAPELWALGLRNPYRMTFDEQAGELWIGDIGSSGGGAWEEINLGVAGANYGWNDGEGPTCFVSDCATHTPAIHQYGHLDLEYATPTLNACVILGPVYRDGSFPAEYHDSLFYGDWSGEWIRRLVLGATGDVVDDVVFDSAPGAGSIADLDVGPDGSLYCVTVGVPWCIPADAGTVYRIDWVGIPPVVLASADVTAGPDPLTVQFSSAGTEDPDSAPSPLTFAWDFGDGEASIEPAPSHVYATAGSYLARLMVSDGLHTVVSDSVAILVGDPPQILRGDCNSDSAVDIADVVSHLGLLFASTGAIGCDDACDANDDGTLDIADPILSLAALFVSGTTLPEPFPTCGYDTGLDSLGCLGPTCP